MPRLTPAGLKPRLKQLGYLALGTTVTIVLLAWSFHDISWPTVWQALSQAHWGWLGLGWLAYLLCYGLRAKRCQTLMSAVGQPGRFQTYLAAVFIGFGASCVLPSYLGELIRAAIPARLEKVSFEAVFGSIVAERILDLGIVFLFLLLPIWAGLLPEGARPDLPIGWLGGAILLIWLLLLLAASLPASLVRMAAALCRLFRLGKFEAQMTASLTRFLKGLGALRQPQRCAVALLETAAIWGLNAVTYWTGLQAFGLVEPGFAGALFTQSVAAFAIALPTTPGYVGSFEAGIRFSLGLYGIPVDLILAYAIALRLVMFVTIPIMALVVAARLGLSRTELLLQRAPQQ